MSNIQQLKCPSCGATLNLDFPNQLMVECPYCHQQVVNDTYRSSGKYNDPRILEFSMNESDVVKLMTDMLIEDPCVPTDIFEKMNITSIKKFYVPMYIYEGTYRAPWTAQIARHEKRQQIGKDGKVEDYYETLYDYPSGEAAGNFSVNGVPSKEMNTLRLNPAELQFFSINPTSLPFFSSVSQITDDGVVLLSPSEDVDYVWREFGNATAQSVGVSAARQQAPDYLTNCSASCELKKTSFVYIPIWIIDYSYNSKNYYYIFYAEKFGSITNPKCKMPTVQHTEEQQKVLNNIKDKRDNFEGQKAFCILFIIVGELLLIIGRFFDIEFLDDLGRDGWFFWFILIGGFSYVAIVMFHNEEKLNEMEKDISKEIEDRNHLLLSKVEKYKRDTCVLVTKSYKGNNRVVKDSMDENVVDNNSANSEISSTQLYSDYQQTKRCVHCGKEINVSHMFCRYCGTKQN